MINRENIPALSTGAVVGAVIPVLLTLNIFATKTDIAQLETKMATYYATKQELKESVGEVKELLKEIKLALKEK